MGMKLYKFTILVFTNIEIPKYVVAESITDAYNIFVRDFWYKNCKGNEISSIEEIDLSKSRII